MLQGDLARVVPSETARGRAARARHSSVALPGIDRDDQGKPRLPLDAATLYAFGHLIRGTEQLLLELFTKGLLSGTTHTCIGQELCQMAVVRALDHPDDVVLSNHRNHGHFLTYSGDFHGLVAEIMGRESGVCQGIGGSQHLAYRNFHSNGVQAGMTAIGAGLALARRLRDSHAIVAVPGKPLQFITGGDGGVVRSDGKFADISAKCDTRGLNGSDTALCKSLLGNVANKLVNMNNGLSTLQFQSLSASAQRPQNLLQGGTQDNGTFQYNGSSVVWPQEIYGDGGQSGFNVADDALRFNTFTGQANDANFRKGDPDKWVIISAPILSSPEGSFFYPPIIADPNPARAGSIFQGSFSVWRTQDWGGSQAYLEANCPEFTTSAVKPGCGDFVIIGNGVPSTDLGSPAWGSRPGGAVAWIARAPQNTGTMWAATSTGRVFITDNADAGAGSVVWNRLDPGTIDPGRAISEIYVDPGTAHHAWIAYNGYNVNTPTEPGHVFEVTWSGAGPAVWFDVSFNLPDFPITAVVSDDVTGDLYAASDFGVMRLPFGAGNWVVAGSGLPMVEVPGLTIVPGARILYAATHGRSAWSLQLP
jgi:hypothetical protein